MALETYKIINKLAPVCFHDLVHMKNSKYSFRYNNILDIRVITKLPNSEQSYKGKVKTHKYIDRQDQSTTGKL